jgi:hypothetical protein
MSGGAQKESLLESPSVCRVTSLAKPLLTQPRRSTGKPCQHSLDEFFDGCANLVSLTADLKSGGSLTEHKLIKMNALQNLSLKLCPASIW